MAQFKAGEIGNPDGRPAGTKNKLTKLRESLMKDAADSVIKSVISAAEGGDMIAAKLCMERIYPKPQLPPERLPEGLVDRTPAMPINQAGASSRSRWHYFSSIG